MSEFSSSILGDNIPNKNPTTAEHISIDGKKFELCELENRLKNSFKKCKIQDMTQLGERINRTEKRIQEYADENRNDEAEKERRYLNELEQLQILSDEITLKMSALLSQTIDKLDLSELENRLKYGLDKCKIKDVTQLIERIKRTEKRIEQYEDEDRTDEAKHEISYLHNLEQLKRITEEIFFRKSTETISNNNDEYNQTRTSHVEENTRADLKNLLDDAAHMPCCAEKITVELLADFQQRLLGDSIVEKIPDSVLLKLERLKEQIQKEELFSEHIRTYLQDLNRTVYNQDCSSTMHVLTKLLKKIRPLHLQETQRLIEKSRKTAELINDKDIILLVGITGSGKSTTIQFLTGAKMKETLVEIAPGKFLEHITIDGPVKNPGLNCVTSSPLSTSETRYIAPVTVQLQDILGRHETGEIILCDAPGFSDTSGPEVDISNSIGVIEAVKNCKSVKILALSSYKSLGDRGQGIQKLANILMNMIPGIENRLDGIFYAFTKYPSTIDINAILVDIKNSRIDLDPAFLTVLTDMIDKTKDSAENIDPIHGDPKRLIKKLERLNGIRYPGEVFRFTMSEETQATILNQVHKYQLNIICGIKHKDIDLVMYYLNNFKVLNDLVQQSSVRDAYENSLRLLNENIDQYCTDVIGKFNRNLLSQDGLKDEDIREYKTAHDYIQQIQNLREHFGSKLVSGEILIENILSELEKRSLTLKEEDLYSSSIGIYFDNFYLLKNSFKQLETYYKKSCQDFAERFQSKLIQSIPELISANEFKQVAERILIISKCLPVLNHHLNGKVEENYHNIIKLILQHLNSFSEKVNSLLMKITLSNADIKILQNYMILLKTAKKTHSLQDQIFKYIEIMKIKNDRSIETIKDLNKIYDELIGKIIKYFDEINLRIKELFDKNGNHALENVEQLVIQMEMIRTLPEMESKTARTFYQSIQNIRGYMQQWQRDAELILDHQSGVIHFGSLRRSLLHLKKTEWIDRIHPGCYDSMMRHIREELEEQADQLERRLNGLDFSLKCPQNIRLAQEILEKIDAMTVLEQSIPELKKYRNRIDENFLRSTKETFDYIQKIFNLSDKTLDHLKQDLIELEQMYSDRVYLRQFGYSDINQLNHETENLKLRQHTELEELENEIQPMKSQLNELNTIVQHYRQLTSSRLVGRRVFSQVITKLAIGGFQRLQSNPGEYLNEKGYASIEIVYDKITPIQEDHDKLSRIIDQTRTDFSNMLTRLETIKKEYTSLLASSNLTAIEEIDFLREKRQTSYEILEKSIQEKKRILIEYEKHKQIFYFTDKLDASAANNALIYIGNCEKIGHQQVREMAEKTNDFLKKYIEEYGCFLEKEIERNFNDITNIDRGDRKKYSEDLERFFQELSSLNKYPLVFEYLHGSEKLEHWHRQFFNYHRSLDHKMEEYKISIQNKELKNLLTIAQALSCIDRFCTTDNGFHVLYRQHQIDMAKMSRETCKKIIDYIAKGDYGNADLALSDVIDNLIDSKYLTQIKHDLQTSVNKIISNTRTSAHSLEDNRNKIKEINENIEKIHVVLNRNCLMELIDQKTKKDLQHFENEINQILSYIILNRLQSIELFIDANHFLEAEQSMENMDRLQRELDHRYISKFVHNKTEELKTRLYNLTNDIVQLYDFTDMNNYSKNPPRDILDQLRKASSNGYAKYAKVYSSFIEQMRVHFSLTIDKIHDQTLIDRSAKIREIKTAFHYLPDQLKTVFQSQIDQLNNDQ